jgi:hypothetical protein
VEYKTNQMHIQLEFDEPLSISPRLKQDKIVFHIKNLT